MLNFPAYKSNNKEYFSSPISSLVASRSKEVVVHL